MSDIESIKSPRCISECSTDDEQCYRIQITIQEMCAICEIMIVDGEVILQDKSIPIEMLCETIINNMKSKTANYEIVIHNEYIRHEKLNNELCNIVNAMFGYTEMYNYYNMSKLKINTNMMLSETFIKTSTPIKNYIIMKPQDVLDNEINFIKMENAIKKVENM